MNHRKRRWVTSLAISSCVILTSILFVATTVEGQVQFEIEGNSEVGVPHFRITEIGQDFTRMTFRNTAQPNKFWTIAAEPHESPGIPRINFYYDSGAGAADRFTVTGEGRVGINTTAPQTNLHVVGNARISDLSGSGTRPVYTDNNGTIIASPSRYLSIPASAFHPSRDDNDVNWVSGTNGAWFEGSESVSNATSMIAPVNLPHGSTIKEVVIHYYDFDPEMVIFRLGYYDQSTNTSGSFFTVNSSGLSGNNSATESSLAINIDNINRSYYFTMGVCFGLDCEDSLTSEFRIRQVVIEYME